MRRTLSAFAVAPLAALVFGIGLSLAGCFSPEEPDCTFRCDDSVGNSNHCPENYTCQADGYCHKNGTSSACPYGTPPDLTATIPADMAKAQDLATTPDLASVSDGSSSD